MGFPEFGCFSCFIRLVVACGFVLLLLVVFWVFGLVVALCCFFGLVVLGLWFRFLS